MNRAELVRPVPASTLHELTPDALAVVLVDRVPPLAGQRDGYGERPTRYRVTLADGRTRRVYALQYGNAASLHVYVDGVAVSLGLEAEHALEAARDRAATDYAAWSRRPVDARAADGGTPYPFTYARHELTP